MRFGCLAALATACARLLPSSAPDLSREAIRPADYGLTKEQWRLCTERIGHAGNEPTAEAEWCQKNIASIEAEERDRRERPERERRKAEERTHYAARAEEAGRERLPRVQLQ